MILKKCILTNKCLCLFWCLILTSFMYTTDDYCKISDHIVRNYIKEFAIPRRLILTSQGGAMMDDIQEISLSFVSFDALNIDQARILYVDMMEELLHRINCHENIRFYLHNYPFLESNIKLMIGFEDSQKKITSDGHVALMSIAKNHSIYFAAYNSVKQEFYTIHEEPYDEALKIVKNLKDILPPCD